MAPYLLESKDANSRALRAVGLRATAPRRAVLSWLVEHPHSTADDITVAVRERLGAVSTQAVYDVLAVCTSARLLRRIEPAGHPARFERRVGDRHHHVICRRCDRTEDVDVATGDQGCLEPDETAGFAVHETEVVFWGICPECATAGSFPDGFPDQEEIRQ